MCTSDNVQSNIGDNNITSIVTDRSSQQRQLLICLLEKTQDITDSLNSLEKAMFSH